MFFGQFLVRESIISENQLAESLDFQTKNPDMRIGEIFVHLEMIAIELLNELLNTHLTASASKIIDNPEFAKVLSE